MACELWLRGQIARVEDVLLQAARALTIRLAEKLAQALSSLMRLAVSMVTPETECLLYATYWFRPILSELIGSARESSEVNRSRAPSGPVKVLVTDRPHRRLNGLVDLTSGASALLAWFPASWASKIAPKLLENAPENAQKPQEINIACPKRSCDETPVEGAKQLLQAVKFAAKNMPGFRLGLDEDFQMAGCFQELIHGYTTGLVEPYMMRGLQPLGPNRTTLEIRPHRFGGEGMLIGGQNSNTKCSMTFVNIAVAISALAWGGGPKTVSHRDQNTVVFSTFFEDFWVSERKRVLKWNFGSFW